VSRHRRP